MFRRSSYLGVFVVVLLGIAAAPGLFSRIAQARPVKPGSDVGAVEYANIEDNEPPRSYILWPLVSPFELGPVGTQLPYAVDGHTLTIYLQPSLRNAPVAATDTATVQYFRRGGLNNYMAVMFKGPAYFVGQAGGQLPTVYDAQARTLTIALP